MSNATENQKKDLKISQVENQMQVLSDWKAELSKAIRFFQYWIKRNKLINPEIELRLFDALKALDSDKLNVAFVAEFSRGKSELINAIFFSEYNRRLLPSDVGRTTMCPTELFYDSELDSSYIKLLPIETRLNDLTLSEIMEQEEYWTSLPLNIESPEQMSESFKEIIKTKQVPSEAAEKLGLLDPDNNDLTLPVEIPVWRHALISFPHPLLKQGLVIMDTPGLNSLGSEPELTLNMLPKAQAVFFILSADTGVTRSDLDLWQQHIKSYRQKQKKGLVAVLNKIDTLWDEMKSEKEIETSIRAQQKNSALLLNIDEETVYPISAQKGLLAKIRNDSSLLNKSRLSSVENVLGNEIIPARQQVVWDNVISGLDQIIEETCSPVYSNLQDVKNQLEDLTSMHGKSDDYHQKLLQKAKIQKVAYYESVKSFQASRKKLALQAKSIFNTLGMESVDKMIGETRQSMSGSWTTSGMKNGMTMFFESARDIIQIAERQIEQTHKLVTYIYQKFNDEHGLYVKEPGQFSLKTHREKLDELFIRGEEFRNSALSTVSEQSFVVKKFFITLVSHARNTFIESNKEIEQWLKAMVNPLISQIQAKKKRIDEHLDNIKKIQSSKSELASQIKSLQKQYAELESQHKDLLEIKDSIKQCQPPDSI